jgi:hypothetical protein
MIVVKTRSMSSLVQLASHDHILLYRITSKRIHFNTSIHLYSQRTFFSYDFGSSGAEYVGQMTSYKTPNILPANWRPFGIEALKNVHMTSLVEPKSPGCEF